MSEVTKQPEISKVATSVFMFYVLVSTIQLINFFVFLAGNPTDPMGAIYIVSSFFILTLNIISIKLLFDGYETIRWFLTLLAVFSVPFVLTALIIGSQVAPTLSAMNFVFNLLVYGAIGLMYHQRIDAWFVACSQYRSNLVHGK